MSKNFTSFNIEYVEIPHHLLTQLYCMTMSTVYSPLWFPIKLPVDSFIIIL